MPFRIFPTLAIFLNRCCTQYYIFTNWKKSTQRLSATFGFRLSNVTQTWFVTQSLVSVFDFTYSFPKKDFQHKVWFQFLILHIVFPKKDFQHKVWFQISIITQDFSITIFINFLAKKIEAKRSAAVRKIYCVQRFAA